MFGLPTPTISHTLFSTSLVNNIIIQKMQLVGLTLISATIVYRLASEPHFALLQAIILYLVSQNSKFAIT